MKFLYFKKQSFVLFDGYSLGYSRNCVIEIDSEVSLLGNREIPYPVAAKITTNRVIVNIELLDYSNYERFLNQIGKIGELIIQGQLLGKRSTQEIEIKIFKACLTKVGQLNLSDGAFPQFEFVGLYDPTVDKVYEITLKQ